jgi:hypothetical protein
LIDLVSATTFAKRSPAWHGILIVSALSAYGGQFPAAPPAASADPSAFADYGWQMFIALNWTPKTGERGIPDCTKR